MENRQRIMVVIATLLLIAVMTEISLIYANHKDKIAKEQIALSDIEYNPVRATKENEIKFLGSQKKNDKIIQEYRFTIDERYINTKVEFSLKNSKKGYKTVEGYLNGELIYSSLIEEKNVNRLFIAREMMKKFSKNNFAFMQSEDGTSYLMVFVEESNQNIHLTIFDKDMNTLKSEDKIYVYLDTQSIILENDETPWYKDTYDLCEEKDCDFRIKIEDNKIYNLFTNYSTVAKSGFLEEREYTIENGKLTYNTGESYKIMSISNKTN